MNFKIYLAYFKFLCVSYPFKKRTKADYCPLKSNWFCSRYVYLRFADFREIQAFKPLKLGHAMPKWFLWRLRLKTALHNIELTGLPLNDGSKIDRSTLEKNVLFLFFFDFALKLFYDFIGS